MNHRYDLYPKIILSNTSARLTIHPKTDQDRLTDDTVVLIRHTPMRRDSVIGSYEATPDQILNPQNGLIEFSLFFKGEQEHKVELILPNLEHIEFRLYSIPQALWDLTPYKGDLHMHTTRSDGREDPAFVTAMCRKIGLDFMAITDHGQYAPSLEAQAAFKDLKLDMTIAAGEEVHGINNAVHIINYGGDFSVNDWMHQNQDELNQRIEAKMAKNLEVRDEKSRFEVACSEVIFDQIRKGKGLAIFCHPYWQIDSGYYISEEVNTYMMTHQPYDALEVIGGYHPFEEESNTIQIARYYEERAKGKVVPIVGVSDAHGCFNNLFGWFYTIVFSKSNQRDDVIQAIKALQSVAVEAIPEEAPRPVGPFDLVLYSLFLIREVFPLHDALCAQEGEWMLKHIEGDPQAAIELEKHQGKVEQFWKRIFGR